MFGGSFAGSYRTSCSWISIIKIVLIETFQQFENRKGDGIKIESFAVEIFD